MPIKNKRKKALFRGVFVFIVIPIILVAVSLFFYFDAKKEVFMKDCPAGSMAVVFRGIVSEQDEGIFVRLDINDKQEERYLKGMAGVPVNGQVICVSALSDKPSLRFVGQIKE